MIRVIGEVLTGLLGLRPPQLQVGALCVRRHKGKREVLLISSLDTGRWIIPKGWPMNGRTLAGAAAQEAWEEAGVRGQVRPGHIGVFTYLKKRDSGMHLRCEVRVFQVEVQSLSERYPEAGRRTREWFTCEEAAERVAEDGLKQILLGL